MTSLASKIQNMKGWRRYLVAFGIGLLAACALSPISGWPVLFIAVPMLVWLLDGIHSHVPTLKARLIPAFATGWAFGAGYFGASLYWVGAAFLVDADAFAWLMPLAVTAMPAGLALFWGAAASLAICFWSGGITRVFIFGAGFALLEWLRGHVLTGFPWNAPAYATDALLPVAQSAHIIGMYGVNFLVLLWSAAPAVLADEADANAGFMIRRAGFLAVAISALAVFSYGKWRLKTVVEPQGVFMRIVQPNIAQKDKWRPENRKNIYQRYLEMTARPVKDSGAGARTITHVIWPESALPALVDEQAGVRRQIAEAAGPGAYTILGGLRRRSASGAASGGNIFNSVLVIDPAGNVVERYDKQKLVPFGEFLPLASFLEPLGLRKLVTLPGGFVAGPGPRTLHVPGIPAFAPLICYEAIFPRALIARNDRPRWLLNVTNDAWFGDTAGPYQHLAQAKMRAIEEGLPLVRAANTGISAVIDPLGRIESQLALGEQGLIDTDLPAPLPVTFYAAYGDTPLMCIILLLILSRVRTFYANAYCKAK